jgi:hypothetical protein
MATLLACGGTSRDQATSPPTAAPASAASTASPESLKLWAGNYEYTHDAGRTAGGTGVVVTYRLEIPGNIPSQARLSIVGFQTNDILLCDIAGTPEQIAVSFRSHADGRTANEFGVSVYQPRQVLFTVRAVGDKRDLVTSWDALKPDGLQTVSGRFFERAGPQ